MGKNKKMRLQFYSFCTDVTIHGRWNKEARFYATTLTTLVSVAWRRQPISDELITLLLRENLAAANPAISSIIIDSPFRRLSS